eukprot:scaffold9892_cov126-Isochrysis_galbana.AAC.3
MPMPNKAESRSQRMPPPRCHGYRYRRIGRCAGLAGGWRCRGSVGVCLPFCSGAFRFRAAPPRYTRARAALRSSAGACVLCAMCYVSCVSTH